MVGIRVKVKMVASLEAVLDHPPDLAGRHAGEAQAGECAALGREVGATEPAGDLDQETAIPGAVG